MLDDKTRDKIRSLHTQHGVDVSALAERFSVNEAAIRNVLGPISGPRATAKDLLEQAFVLLQIAARNDERCPMNDAVPGGAKSVSALARQGKILVEVYVHNFRRVTILEGDCKGLSTASPPNLRGRSERPYLTVGTEGKRYHAN